MNVRASEESLTCAANTTFWPQKTAYILSYPQSQRTKQKKGSNAHLILLQEKKDPRSTPWGKEPISGSCNWLLSLINP